MISEEIRCTREVAVYSVSELSDKLNRRLHLVMHVNMNGEWEIHPDYKWIPFPNGQNMKTYVAAWLAQHVSYKACGKYFIAQDRSILAIDLEFFPEKIVYDTTGEIYFCLFHTCMALLPESLRQQVFELRKIEQSGYALEIDVPYAYASTDFAHAKNWLLNGAKIPEAIEEIGINPNVVFQAIEADLIDWEAAFCFNEEERTARLAKVHDTMQRLIEENGFVGLPQMDVFGDFNKAIEKLFAEVRAK